MERRHPDRHTFTPFAVRRYDAHWRVSPFPSVSTPAALKRCSLGSKRHKKVITVTLTPAFMLISGAFVMLNVTRQERREAKSHTGDGRGVKQLILVGLPT